MNRAQRRAAKAHPSPKNTDRVVVAYVHGGEVSESFMDSLWRLNHFEVMENGRMIGKISKKAGTGGIADARNLLTKEFLAMDADWLLFIDSDMGFAPWALSRMLGAATSQGLKPIVGGLCFALATTGWDPETNGETFECWPTIGIWNRNEAGEIQGYFQVRKWEKDSVIRVDSTGAALLLLHRSALEKLGPNPWAPLPTPEGVLEDNSHFSEDISFFMRCADHDLEVWLDTGARTSHHKGAIYLSEQTWELQEALKAVDA